jgi:hypothetical protein
MLRLGQRQLVATPVELVAAVLEPVRPGNQELAAAGGARLPGTEAVDDILAVCAVRAEAAADLDRLGALIAELDLNLRGGWLDPATMPPVESQRIVPTG